MEAKDSQRAGQKPTARVVRVCAGRPAEARRGHRRDSRKFSCSRLEFPEDALAEAEAVPDEIPESELAQRVFYEHPVTFTIDPEDAKDHDDAIALRVEPDGKFTLLVHIADVSYYVKEDSPIDREARERATSVYLPGKVYPMLPPRVKQQRVFSNFGGSISTP